MTPAQIYEARLWLSECAWADVDAEEIMAMAEERITRAIKRHYAGGLLEFVKDCIAEDIH